MSPRPTQDEFRQFYATSEIFSVEAYSKRAESRTAFYQARLAGIESQLGRKSTLLEIGCGAGHFLKLAKDAGWKVCGTELSESFQKNATERFGLDVRRAVGLAGCAFREESFDVVYSAHVFEHLLDPLGTLVEARRVIKRNGILVIEVPNQFQSLRSGLRGCLAAITGPAGEGWVFRKPMCYIHHVYFFSPDTLNALVCRAGFSVMRMQTYEKHHRQVIGDAPLGGYWLTEMTHRIGAAFGRGPIVLLWAVAN
jgi:SAM-dependent methyltransferase